MWIEYQVYYYKYIEDVKTKKTIWKNPNNFNELEVNENCLIDNRTGEQFIKDENEIIQFIQKEEIDGSNKKSTDFYNSFAPFYEIGQKI